MDGLSVATNVLANKKLVAAIGAAIPTAAMPALASVVVAPIVKEIMRRGR